MMDIGTAGFLSTCILTAGGVTLKWISTIPKSNNVNGKCPLHDDVIKRLADGDKCMEELREDSKTTRRLSIAIAARLNIPIGDLKNELQDMVGGE
jgi:hypothetical protein